MFRQILLLFSIFYLTTAEINKKVDADFPEKNRMMGIDAVHDKSKKIDKDTIITRNLKLEKRIRGQKSISNKIEEDQEPDWSYKSFPKEVATHVEQFKKNMSECLKEVQSSDKRPVKRLSPKMESPVHGECLIACVLKRNGVIVHGKINKAKTKEFRKSWENDVSGISNRQTTFISLKNPDNVLPWHVDTKAPEVPIFLGTEASDNLISLVSKFYAKDTKLMKKLDKNLDRCIEISIHHQDECMLASKLNDCTNDLMASNKHKIMVNY